ncbi:hypothetical protein V0M98_36840 (plasmid) [Pseudomonas silesiensis]|uniref:hypothetical protein n=1 Tax=Pseudomonas silesiensis TaxID=1853130 RepID=UPI0030D56779
MNNLTHDGTFQQISSLFHLSVEKFQHFHTAIVTPRVVKIAILKPQAIIGLLRNQHQEAREGKPIKESFEESLYMDWEAWSKPMVTSLPIWDHERGLKCHLNGLTPMEAVQHIHANSKITTDIRAILKGAGTLRPTFNM